MFFCQRIHLSIVLYQIQKLYSRYVRAESFRKALVYQKRYLLLLLGGFQECEQTTLAMISRMGAYPVEQPAKHPRGFSRFRMAVRAVIAIGRMRFLVNKTKRVSKRVSDDRSRHSGQPSNSPGSARANQTIYEPITTTRRSIEPSFPGQSSSDTRRDPVGGPIVSNGQVTAIPLTNGYGEHRRQPTRMSRPEPLLSSTSTIPYTAKPTRSASPPRTSRASSSSLRSSPRTSDRYRPPMSPPVRDSDSEDKELDGLAESGLPRHSSPRLSSYHTSTPSPVENGDHSLSMYIQRLESLQNRLASSNKGL